MLKWPRRGVLLTPALISATAQAQAAPEVDLLLVLAMDASGSIDGDEFRLQREGIGNPSRIRQCWMPSRPIRAAPLRWP